MSIVDKVAKVDIDPARDQALERLQAAQSVLEDSSATQNAKHQARVSQLAELVELNRFADIARLAQTESLNESAYITTVAYAFYRLGELMRLRDLVKESSPVGARSALAQAEYKAGNLEAARSLLEHSKNAVDEEDLADVAVNLSAINALRGEELETSALSAYDANYNMGCYYLTRGQLSKALEFLQTALSHAEEDDDRQSAVVQAGVAHLSKGNKDEARQLFEQISDTENHKNLSNSLRLVSTNNLASLDYDGSLIGAHEALKAYDELRQHESEVIANQREILYRNMLKLKARAGLPGTSKKAQKFREKFHADFEPEVVALTYTKTPKQIRKLAAEGSQAAKFWIAAITGSKHGIESSQLQLGNFGSLLAAVSHLEQGDDAGKVTEYFKSLSPQFAQAGLASQNPGNCELDQNAIDTLVGDIDASQSEAEGIPSTAPEASGRAPVMQNKKRKRSGKPKLPSSYDPAQQPNPERWLPKEDRSDYKPKKSKKSQATQGFAAGETAEVHTASTSQVVGAKATKKKKKGRK